MDIEIAIDAIHNQRKYDIAVFLTGDSDFFALIKYLMNAGKKCFIFSSRNSVSKELKTNTSGYFEIMKIPELWGEKLRYRNQKK